MNVVAGVVSLVVAATLPLGARVLPAQETPAEQKVTLAFAGDIHFEAGLRNYAKAGGLDPMRALYDDADFVMANLETSITSRGKAEKKTYTFRAPARAVDALASANINVVSMANNHALDYGLGVIGDSLRAFAGKSTGVVGIGADQDQALMPYRTGIGEPGNQLPISVFAVASNEMLGGGLVQRWSATPTRGGIVTWDKHRALLLDAIKAEREAGRFVIVYAHWGRELNPCPTTLQRSMVAAMESAGASLIVGTHPHILQPAGFTQSGTPVIFSTGNFVWYHGRGGATGVIKVTVIDGKATSMDVTPAYIRNGLPRQSESARPAAERALFKLTCSPLQRTP